MQMLQFNTLISLPLGASCSKSISPFDSSNNNHWSPISSRTLLYLADTCFVLVVTIDMHWHIVFMQIAGSFSYSKISFNKLNCSKLWCQPSSASCLTSVTFWEVCRVEGCWKLNVGNLKVLQSPFGLGANLNQKFLCDRPTQHYP